MALHQDVARAWADRKPRSVTGHNMDYDGDATVYSYSWWPLGTWREDKRGRPVIYLNTSYGSNSTSKHEGHTWQAAYWTWPDGDPVERGVPMFTLPHKLWGDHHACLAYLLDLAVKEVERARRARVYKELDTARRLFADAREFAECMGIPYARHVRKPQVALALGMVTVGVAA
jgi:hypothetical protein